MGLKRALRRFIRGRKARLSSRQRLDGFAAWQKFNEPSDRTRRLIEESSKDVPTDIRFSFIVPAGLTALDATLENLVGQSYTNFEIVLIEEASGALQAALERWEQRDNRLRRLRVPPTVSAAAAFNLALDGVIGDFIIPLEESGIAHQDALLLFANHIAKHPTIDLLYGDDALMSGSGALSDPRFKPDWSPELLLSYFYTAPFQAFRTSLVKELGGCRSEVDGAQLYDLTLRIGEKARHVGHIPQILFTRSQDVPPFERKRLPVVPWKRPSPGVA